MCLSGSMVVPTVFYCTRRIHNGCIDSQIQQYLRVLLIEFVFRVILISASYDLPNVYNLKIALPGRKSITSIL